MSKKTWSLALSIVFLATWMLPLVVEAYTINNFFVQQRYYEDKTKGPNGNGQLVRVWLDIKDDNGAYITQNLLTSVALYDPNGAQVDDVTLENMSFDSPYTEVDGNYDGSSGFWYFNDPYAVSGYYTAFEKGTKLIVGTYRISIVYDGITLEKTFDFAGKVALAYVKSSTISYHIDNKGNLIATWDIPDNLLRTFPSVGISSRAMIEVYKKVSKTKKKCVYYLGVRVPLAAGRLFVPKALVTAIKASTTKRLVYITIQARTNNNCNRSLSKPVEMTKLE